MFDFIKSLINIFNKKPKYPLGAFESPIDTRNISITTIQTPVSLPDEYETELPPVETQKGGICVGEAIHKIAELYLSPEKTDEKPRQWINLSPEDLYEQCKLIDGIKELDGTYPSIGAKVACMSGIATVEAYNTGDPDIIKASREKNKLKGYAFVPADYNSICQAIFQKRAITASFDVDSNWFIGKITKVLKSIGRHYVVLNGFKISSQILKGQNSWGNWIGYIAGIINPNVKNGCFEMAWVDVQNTIHDIIAFTEIPKDIVEEVKNTNYRFMTKMSFGSRGYEVKKLQERLGIIPTDGIFGNNTRTKVIEFQTFNHLITDGTVGPSTRAKLNEGSKSFLPQWIEAIKIMEKAKPERNNPGNLRYIGQNFAVNDKGFCKFDTYEHGYEALKSLLIRASTGTIKPTYYPEMTLVQFYHKYAPTFDGNNPNEYANFVAKKIGVPVTTQIKYLI